MTVFETSKQHKKSAAEGGRLHRQFFCLLYNHFLEVQNQIYTYWTYLMEYMCFTVQVCIKISMFDEFCEIYYICHPNLGTSMDEASSLFLGLDVPYQVPCFTNHCTCQHECKDHLASNNLDSCVSNCIPTGPPPQRREKWGIVMFILVLFREFKCWICGNCIYGHLNIWFFVWQHLDLFKFPKTWICYCW